MTDYKHLSLTMTAEAFREALQDVGLMLKGAATLFQQDPDTVHAWASGEKNVPADVALALWLMKEFDVSPLQAIDMLYPDVIFAQWPFAECRWNERVA